MCICSESSRIKFQAFCVVNWIQSLYSRLFKIKIQNERDEWIRAYRRVGLTFSKDRTEWISNFLLKLKESEFRNEPDGGMELTLQSFRFHRNLTSQMPKDVHYILP